MDILLFKNESFLGKIIRFFTRGKYSHAAVRLDSGEIYEAVTKEGVRKLMGIKYIEGKNKIDVYTLNVPLNKINELNMRDFLDKQIGKKYDYWMVLGFVIKSTRQGRKSRNRWYCSELCAAALEKAGIQLLITQPWKISPEMISYSPMISPRYWFRTNI